MELFQIGAAANLVNRALAHYNITHDEKIGQDIVLVIAIVIFVAFIYFSKKKKHEDIQSDEVMVRDMTDLMRYSANGEIDGIDEELIYNNAKVNEYTKNGFTALMYAARNNHLEAAKRLVQLGADVHQANNEGVTAYDLAIRFNCMEVAYFLDKQQLKQS